MLSHGGTCRVHGDLKGQRAATMWGVISLLSRQLWCGWYRITSLAASTGVTLLDRGPSPGLGRMSPQPLASVWQRGGSVISVDEQLNCTVLRPAAEEHRGSFSSWNVFIVHPPPKPRHCLSRSSLSLNGHTEPATNSRLDVLYTYTFTSEDRVS